MVWFEAATAAVVVVGGTHCVNMKLIIFRSHEKSELVCKMDFLKRGLASNRFRH